MQNFKLVKDYSFWWPVPVSIPDAVKAGEFITQTLEVHFRAITQREAEELEDSQREQGIEPFEAQNALLRRVCQDWRKVEDESGQPIPFTQENFNQALQHGWFRTAVYLAYAKALSGDAARLGN